MEQGRKNNNMFYIFKGVIFSLIFTFAFLLIFSVMLTYTNISENTIEPVIIILTAVSIFLGSSIGNMNIKKNGIINGSIIGGMYLLFLYVFSSIINSNFSLNIRSIIIILLGMFCGVIGGILGVNKR